MKITTKEAVDMYVGLTEDRINELREQLKRRAEAAVKDFQKLGQKIEDNSSGYCYGTQFSVGLVEEMVKIENEMSIKNDELRMLLSIRKRADKIETCKGCGLPTR